MVPDFSTDIRLQAEKIYRLQFVIAIKPDSFWVAPSTPGAVLPTAAVQTTGKWNACNGFEEPSRRSNS